MSNISSLHGSFRVRGLVARIGLGGPCGSFRVRVGVSVRFSVSVGVSVVDRK